jgi:hypothetical protein
VLDGAGMRRADARPLRHAVECWRRCAPSTAASQVHLMCFLSPSRTPAPNNMLTHTTHTTAADDGASAQATGRHGE